MRGEFEDADQSMLESVYIGLRSNRDPVAIKAAGYVLNKMKPATRQKYEPTEPD